MAPELASRPCSHFSAYYNTHYNGKNGMFYVNAQVCLHPAYGTEDVHLLLFDVLPRH